MINERSIKACDLSRFGPFQKPLYDSYCFSRIPATVRSLLLGTKEETLPVDTFIEKRYDFVVVMLIDAFGWRSFETFAAKYPFLQRFIDKGIVSKLTSQFPSTTTNHVTCMHTGLDVGQSGMYEWFYYEPMVDAPICPLHFSFAKDHGLNSLLRAGVRPKELFNFRTFYEDLQERGIQSFTFQHKESANSPYSQVLLQGSNLVGYKNLPEALSRLSQELLRAQEKSYFFFYFGDIDGAGHGYGPNSAEFAQAVERCFSRLELFWQEISAKKGNGCLIVTADHGMAAVKPEDTWFLNRQLPDFERFIKRNQKDELIVPCGSSRDFFLHIKEPHLDVAKKELTQALDGIGEVHRTDSLIEQGFFGMQPPSERLLARVGNLVLLPYGTNSFWWHEPGRFENPYHGHHGGLTAAELETIFLFQEI